MMELARWDFEKDSENKRFLDSMFNKVAMAGVAVVVVGAAVLGGRATLTQRETGDED